MSVFALYVWNFRNRHRAEHKARKVEVLGRAHLDGKFDLIRNGPLKKVYEFEGFFFLINKDLKSGQKMVSHFLLMIYLESGLLFILDLPDALMCVLNS